MRSQSGSVLIYILIGVALLAALTYAVTQSSRSGSSAGMSSDRARLYATELIENANSIANAVAQLRLRGVDATALCFDDPGWTPNYDHSTCSDDTNKLYAPDGGGLTWSLAPEEAMDSAATPDNLYHFYGNNEIEKVGSTTGDANGADLILLVDELSIEVCQKINELLGVTAANTTPPTDTDYGATRFIGAFSYSETIGDEDATLEGKTAACFQNTTSGEYAFYKVLVAR